MIKLINVVKKFGKIEAVKGINLEVEKGSLFAFLGENGAGKSTTLSMICTESEPTSGEINPISTKSAAALNNINILGWLKLISSGLKMLMQSK